MPDVENEVPGDSATETYERRSVLGVFSFGIMLGGLIAGYGRLVGYVGQFLYPTGRGATAWQFVATLDSLRLGESLAFTTSTGAKLVVARQSDGDNDGDSADNFIALSSVCPHLGCAVHWESQNNRFFCPCHNGAFDASGKATEGPPAAAKQELSRYPLKVEKGLLYVEVPTETVGQQQEA
ncbi:MAG: Rieske (2Fe-2S) protein [Planctomycetales bacterium]|nr:Rieske (2Fe-2S) protein [Planctomycetales bacterium]